MKSQMYPLNPSPSGGIKRGRSHISNEDTPRLANKDFKMATSDLSYKDNKYFIDETVYNCPFCNRKNIGYVITQQGSYNNYKDKKTYFYIVQCSDDDCLRESFHLSEYELETKSYGVYEEARFMFPPKLVTTKYSSPKELDKELDNLFYYHEPTSFFTLDKRIPEAMRKAINEADQCLKFNCLTGAAACLRKALYKLLQL